MTQRMEAQGWLNPYADPWDDKSDHDDVTKIYIRCNSIGIISISFEYVKDGKPDRSFHGESYNGYTQTFVVNHLNKEYLQSVEGYYTERDGIQALKFKTNLRMSELMGNMYDEGDNSNKHVTEQKNGMKRFTLAMEGKKIIGFHGSGQVRRTCNLGAYFTWVTPTRMEAKGGKRGGREWDDGAGHEGVTKIHVRGGLEGTQNIKFEYVDKDGHSKVGPIHGSIYGRGSPHLFEIKHVDNEYLVSVEGYYDDEGVITALQFKTNIKTSELIGSHIGRKKFRLAASGMKIIGFHGFAENNLNSLGAYFMTVTPSKLECQGTPGDVYWDDGAFKGIRNVKVFYRMDLILCLRITYDNDGKLEKRDHGRSSHSKFLFDEGEFVIDYPNEVITSVEGSVKHDYDMDISSLTFKTSKGRTSKKFGDQSAVVEFVLESKGCAIVGFHGWTDKYLRSHKGLGAYFYPMPPPPPAEKLESKGGDGGDPWDDGASFEDVRKIYIGLGEIGIASIKFLYQNDTQEVVVGDHHGSKTLIGYEEFELEYPGEYLISVEGSYDVVPGTDECQVILMLKFTTNKRTSPCFGLDDDSSFMLYKEGHKIVGFHGNASNMLNQIGVHVLPITC